MTEIDGRELASQLRDPDEETRYRAVRTLDGGTAAGLSLLLERLGDESWRVRKATVDRLCAIADAIVAVPALVLALGDAEDAGARNSAAEALARMGVAAVPALLEKLNDEDPDLRKFALDILGEIRDSRSVMPVAACLVDANPNVRAAAAEALGKIGGVEAIAALQVTLDASDHLLKLAALDALARLKTAPALERLVALSQDRFLKRPVYRLLGRSTDPRVFPLLAQGLLEPSRGTRDAALAAIGEQRRFRRGTDVEALARAVREAAKYTGVGNACEAALRTGDTAVCEGALAVLGWIGDLNRAVAIAHAAEDERLRLSAVEALASLGSGVGQVLRPSLELLSPPARAAALSVLARVGDAAVLPALLDAIEEDEEEVRSTAIDALGQLGDLRAVEPLMDLADSEDAGVSGAAVAALSFLASRSGGREATVRACRAKLHLAASGPLIRLLGQIGDSDDIRRLRDALKGPNSECRRAAADALGNLGLSAALEPLRLALTDEDAGVRAGAAHGLGTLSQRAMAPGAQALRDDAARALSSALRDADETVRATAAEALGRCGVKSYMAAIAELIDDRTSAATAIVALRALGSLGSPDPSVLVRASLHKDPEVVKEAIATAIAIAGPAGTKLLLSGASHARWDVRRAAARAIAARRDRLMLDDLRRLAETEKDALAGEAMQDAIRILESGV